MTNDDKVQPMSLTFLLAGGSGFIGSRLSELARSKGHSVRILTRKPKVGGQFAWDILSGAIDDRAVEGADVVVNLAGAGIADGRWTPARKRLIAESRVRSAQVLRDAFRRLGHLPKSYLSASAIGYYGNSGERVMYEDDSPVGGGFLVDTCAAWEQAVEETGAMGIRTVVFRTGIALGASGGALPRIAGPLRFGIGGYFADGKAWYSWIHLDDLCRMYLWAAEQPLVEGVFNAVAPHPVRNLKLVKATAQAMRRPAIFVPAPAFALRLVFGEMAGTILNSNRISAEKVIRAGFHFQFPDLEGAMNAIFR